MKTSSLRRRRTAFSLTELVITIAIIGIITSIAIPVYSNVTEQSRKAVAVDHLESLNRAVTDFGHNCWKLPTPADASGTADEYAVLRSLQWKFPYTKETLDQMKSGSPYFDPRYDPAVSSKKTEYRIRWNGRSFELLDKGQDGTGFRFNSGSDFKATPYSFPSGYKPEGAF